MPRKQQDMVLWGMFAKINSGDVDTSSLSYMIEENVKPVATITPEKQVRRFNRNLVRHPTLLGASKITIITAIMVMLPGQLAYDNDNELIVTVSVFVYSMTLDGR
jgi:formaldehyde-activating enzyme involved in methanogenesis